MRFGAIIAKKRVGSSKSVYPKNLISGSQRRWTLGFCMEATQSVSPLINIGSGRKHKKTIFDTLATGAHENRGICPKCQ